MRSSTSGTSMKACVAAGWKRDFAVAAGVVLLSAVVALLFNKLRSEGLPVIAQEPYQIYVPCPETAKEAGKQAMPQAEAGGAGVRLPADAVVVDARSPALFSAGPDGGAAASS